MHGLLPPPVPTFATTHFEPPSTTHSQTATLIGSVLIPAIPDEELPTHPALVAVIPHPEATIGNDDGVVPSAPAPISSQSSHVAEETKANPRPPSPIVDAIPQTPQTYITFLTISGNRRTMNFDPSVTIGRVKDLVWNAWPAEWPVDERPPAPSYLRLLYLGKMLQDDETLSNLKLPTFTPPSPAAAATSSSAGPPSETTTTTPTSTSTIMHISVRPFAGSFIENASVRKKLRRGSSGGGSVDGQDAQAGCCGCVIC